MKEKILILVKTYPTFSQTYFELVCTAGINEKGAWRRIYPIPFRELKEIEKYKKYQWIQADFQRNSSDMRKESFKLKSEISILGEPLETKNNWQNRKEVLFKKTPVFENLKEVIQKAHQNELSLCIFKPNEITKFAFTEIKREWDASILNKIKAQNMQRPLLKEFEKEIKLIRKLPYKFYYHFKDVLGKESKLMIEDWEIGQLFWNCLRQKGNEKEALKDVAKKYQEEFLSKKDIFLFLGTTLEFHRRKARNPFVIVGVFYPPKSVTRINSNPKLEF